jgi:hypothetical protein
LQEHTRFPRNGDGFIFAVSNFEKFSDAFVAGRFWPGTFTADGRFSATAALFSLDFLILQCIEEGSQRYVGRRAKIYNSFKFRLKLKMPTSDFSKTFVHQRSYSLL